MITTTVECDLVCGLAYCPLSGASCEGGLIRLSGLVGLRYGYPAERCSFGNVSKAKSFGSGFVAQLPDILE